MTAVTEEATRLTELSALVEMALGHPLDQETFRALFSIQKELSTPERKCINGPE